MMTGSSDSATGNHESGGFVRLTAAQKKNPMMHLNL
jgi:hypothetical protein